MGRTSLFARIAAARAPVARQGAIRSAVLARWSGARVVYGAAEPRESPASLWYTSHAIAHGAHVIEQYGSLAQGVVRRKMTIPRAQLPSDGEAERRIDRKLAEAGVRDFAILNPGAGWGA